MVVKNLTKDPMYYTKNSAFGKMGIGYTDEAPGLKASKSDQMEKVKINESYEETRDNMWAEESLKFDTLTPQQK